jgi:hypothetical protein
MSNFAFNRYSIARMPKLCREMLGVQARLRE